MTRRAAWILFENSRDAQGHFAPGELLLACCADELGIAGFWSLRSHVHVDPKRGFESVLQTAGRRAHLLLRSASRLVLVLDGDQVRRKLGIAARSTDAAVERTIRSRSQCPDETDIFLIDRNVETLVKAAARAMGRKL